MSELAQIIASEIDKTGPIGVDRYMELCLSHPQYGYYFTRDPLGSAGDFTTAPEVHQIFGELIGLWLAQVWLDLGEPETVNLVELGPGRGTLMADILRVAKKIAGFREAVSLKLIETSPALRALQKQTLQDCVPVWIASVDDLDDKPTLFVANEFFDALPVKQFQRIDDIWLERCIKRGPDGEFVYGLRKTQANGLPEIFPDGGIIETCTAAAVISRKISDRIGSGGGAALYIDYGTIDGSGDTLQAVRSHKFVPPLKTPGECDLTCHVNFASLFDQTNPKIKADLTTQRQFLAQMGIHERAAHLARATHAATIETAVHKLTSPEEMGDLFKVLAITGANQPQPPGF